MLFDTVIPSPGTDEREAVFRPTPYKTMARLESHLDDSTWAWKSFYTK